MSIRHASEEDVNNGVTPIADVPDAPTIGAVSDPGTDGYASVAFTAATTGGAVTTYTATSTPGTLTGTSATSPISVTGLTLSTAYTFKVKGANSTATGPESSASSTFTPAFHPSGAYDSIQTHTLTASQASITFSSIPATYTHLQIRAMARTDRATVVSGDWMKITLNSDTGSNYAFHLLQGDGATASATASASAANMEVIRVAGAASTASGFGAVVFDLLDYANTSKYKTQRTLGGYDNNGAGVVALSSGVWMNTNAVTSITFVPGGGTNFVQYSSFALYGIRGN